jgi:hypothetical protein
LPLDQTQVIAGRNLLAYTEPWSPSNTMPADTILWGDPQPSGSLAPGTAGWGGSWVNLGFTRDGLRFRMNVERQDILVDQVVDPILRVPTRRNLNMETALAQINAQNLANATGQGSISTVAPGAGTRGHTDYIVAGTIIDLYYSTGFDILSPGTNEAVRVVGWKGLAMADVEMQFNVTDAARIAYNIAVIPDTGTAANPISPPRLATFRVVSAPI